MEFQLQMMERKVARAGGERSDDETRVLNGRIAKLTETLEGVNAEHGMLSGQVKKAEEDLGGLHMLMQEHSGLRSRYEQRLADTLVARMSWQLGFHCKVHSYHAFQIACGAHPSQLRVAQVPLLCQRKHCITWGIMLTSPAWQLLCKPSRKA